MLLYYIWHSQDSTLKYHQILQMFFGENEEKLPLLETKMFTVRCNFFVDRMYLQRTLTWYDTSICKVSSKCQKTICLPTTRRLQFFVKWNTILKLTHIVLKKVQLWEASKARKLGIYGLSAQFDQRDSYTKLLRWS